ncbi:MAG: sigma-70 family RNA polymerase sigma factor [Haliscomenobacteraceae bacterium CHB4]|nr:sigma-70 family RNA polymerase sigma factor [Haliscomenobacteraceae bacterium CHB4]
MPKARFTDEDIIRRLQSGDARRVEETTAYLLGQYRGMVVKLAHRLSEGVEPEVDTILDEALSIVVQHVRNGKYKPEKGAALSTYFHAIATNILSNILRRRRYNKELPVSEFPPERPLLTLPEAEKMMNSADARKKVAAAIQRLDPVCRQVLTGLYWEDQSMREIAHELNKSEDVAKQRHHRCLKRLRELLDNDFKNWFNEK